MAIDVSEALAAAVTWQPDVPDDLFELLTGLALADGSVAASNRLLRNKCLPLELAEKLVARRGVSAAELVAFASREDMPAATLQEWVRKERRVTVLAELAAKPDLPRLVFETLATRKGVALRKALLFNESAPVDVRADIASDLLGADMPHRDAFAFKGMLASSEPLQRAVFDRLNLSELDDCRNVSGWQGLVSPQLHSLLGVVELLVAAHWETYKNGAPARRAQHDAMEFRNAAGVTWNIANHPAADEALLARIETFVDSYDLPLLKHPRLADDAASARQRLAAFGGDYASAVSAPYAQLVKLADSGVLCTLRLTELAVTNPLFDAGIAVKILAAATLSHSVRDITGVLTGWAPDLVSAVRVQRAVTVPAAYRGLDSHIREASTGELLAALDSVADSPEWNRILAVRFAVAADSDAVTDELIGRFGWFPGHVGRVECRPLGVLTIEYLRRRFGDHVPTWQMFAAVADPSTPLAEAAALAVHAEPPPNPPDLSPVEEVT